jgi:type IV pilus assembly protein PilO
MTAAGDFLPEENQEFEEGLEPTYPTAFGIQFTPVIQGVLIFLLGLLGAFAFYRFLVGPAREEKAQLESQVEEKELQVAQQQANLRKIEEVEAELDRAVDQRVAIYSLLGNKQSLETLLLDINQQIENSNAAIADVVRSDLNRVQTPQLSALGLTPQQVQQINEATAENPALQKLLYTSELFQFSPQGVEIIEDGSLGEELDGKLQRYTVEVSMQALFPQTLSILRNLERLEPLIVIRDFQQSPQPPEGFNEEDLVGITPMLQSDFTLQVLVPVNEPTDLPPPPEPEADQGSDGGNGGNGGDAGAE